MTLEVIIIGSGMAGLSCARVLTDAGYATLVVDKGRGVGGRMATRRVTHESCDLRFDHGAQYLSTDDPLLLALLQRCPEAVTDWHLGKGKIRKVGVPGMSSLPRAMAEGLQVRQGVEVTGLRPEEKQMIVETDQFSFRAPHVVLTVPAPQAMVLLGNDPLVAKMGHVVMAPCLTLMAAFAKDAPRPFQSLAPDHGPLAWIAQDSSKPGRASSTVTWVAQATEEWSMEHLEADKETIAAQMLQHLCDAIDARPDAALHVAAHRWRYARVTRSLGQAFLRHPSGMLHLGGDWCIGPKVEHAVASGEAIARDILGLRDEA
jgi:renalase